MADKKVPQRRFVSHPDFGIDMNIGKAVRQRGFYFMVRNATAAVQSQAYQRRDRPSYGFEALYIKARIAGQGDAVNVANDHREAVNTRGHGKLGGLFRLGIKFGPNLNGLFMNFGGAGNIPPLA